jgi:hypothetical protein
MTASLTIRSARVVLAISGTAAGLLVSLGGDLTAQAFSTRAAMTPAVEIKPTPAPSSASGYRVMAGERAIYDVELRGHGVGTDRSRSSVMRRSTAAAPYTRHCR